LAREDGIRRQSMAEDKIIKAVLEELESTLTRFEAGQDEKERDMFKIGCRYGYIDGLKRAIDIVNFEIGIRQNPPNINYPGNI
jgi:hypothetical protein